MMRQLATTLIKNPGHVPYLVDNFLCDCGAIIGIDQKTIDDEQDLRFKCMRCGALLLIGAAR